MRHLADDHVDLVRLRRGDHHVGVARARRLEHVRMRGEAGDAADIVGFGDAPHEARVRIDHGHAVGVLFAREVARDLAAHLTRAADDDLHVLISVAATAARPRRRIRRVPLRSRSG
jgi:hypothetical protein